PFDYTGLPRHRLSPLQSILTTAQCPPPPSANPSTGLHSVSSTPLCQSLHSVSSTPLCQSLHWPPFSVLHPPLPIPPPPLCQSLHSVSSTPLCQSLHWPPLSVLLPPLPIPPLAST
ncbi:unnamed protein product, partial [Staurois parvus]